MVEQSPKCRNPALPDRGTAKPSESSHVDRGAIVMSIPSRRLYPPIPPVRKTASGRLRRRRSGISHSSCALSKSTSTKTIPFPSLRPTLIRPSKTERLPGNRVVMPFAAQQIVGNDLSPNFKAADPAIDQTIPDPTIRPMPTGSYNAELFKQLTPSMKAKLRALYS